MDKKLAALPDPSPEGKLPPAVAKGAAGATMPASTAGKPVTASASLGRKPPAQTVQQLSDSKAPAKGPVPPPAVGVPPQSASAPPTSTAGPMAPVHAAKEGVPPGGGAPQQIGSETKAQAPAAAGDASSAVPPSKGQIGAVPAKSAIPPAPVQPAPAASAPTGGVPGPVTGPAGVDSMVEDPPKPSDPSMKSVLPPGGGAPPVRQSEQDTVMADSKPVPNTVPNMDAGDGRAVGTTPGSSMKVTLPRSAPGESG
mmetsp:Transcript_137/g.363  ORF Transcript_137/g.363 Transcript_137/m.363 type:complete len:254 (-) Transcript_137:200-961(-)